MSERSINFQHVASKVISVSFKKKNQEPAGQTRGRERESRIKSVLRAQREKVEPVASRECWKFKRNSRA